MEQVLMLWVLMAEDIRVMTAVIQVFFQLIMVQAELKQLEDLILL